MKSWLFYLHRVFGCPEIPVEPPYDNYVWICRCGAHWEGQIPPDYLVPDYEGPPWVRVK